MRERRSGDLLKRTAAAVIAMAAVSSCMYTPAAGAVSSVQTAGEEAPASIDNADVENEQEETSQPAEESDIQDTTSPDEPPVEEPLPEDVFQYEDTEEGAVITGYTGSDENVAIPAEIDGKTVVAVGDNAFAENEDITSVEFPETVIYIGENAFKACSGLESITIPANVKTIAAGAFAKCFFLKEVTLSEGVESIGKGAFDGIPIAGITIPASLKSAESPFTGCKSLKTVNFAEGVKTIPGSGDQEEPTGGLFSGCPGLTAVELPEGIEVIGDCAFSGCDKLTELILPSTLRKINYRAFYGCKSLRAVEIPAGVSVLESECFADCRVLYDVKLNEGLTELGVRAFANDPVKEIYIPVSLESAEAPFYHCGNLNSVTFGEGIKKIPSAHTEILNKYGLFAYCSGLREITIPEGVEQIDTGAFRNCTSLVTVNVPESLTSMGDYAFADCPRLQNLNGGIINIYANTFLNCTMFKDERFVLLEASDSYVSCDSVTSQVGGAVSFTVSYKFAKDISAYSDPALSIFVPEGLEIIPETFVSSDSDITPESIKSGSIPVKQEGKFSFACRVKFSGEHRVTASASFSAESRDFDMVIGSACVEARELAIESAVVTDKQTARIYGIAGKGETFGIFVNGRPAKTVTASSNTGRFIADVTLPASENGTYVITAKVNKTESNSIKVKYNDKAPIAEKVEIGFNNGKKTDITDAFTDGKAPVIISQGAYPFQFSVKLRNSSNADRVYISGTYADKTGYIELFRSGTSDTWTAEGFFFPHDAGCMPEVINVKIVPKEGVFQPVIERVPVAVPADEENEENAEPDKEVSEPSEPAPVEYEERIIEPAIAEYIQFSDGARLRFVKDMTGFVYEGLTSHRVDGVTLTLYTLDEETGEKVVWNSSDYDQPESVHSGYNGEYLFVIPEGRWKIVCEKEGFDRAESDWIEAPRAAGSINIAMVSHRAPKPVFAEINENTIKVRFTELMDVSSVTPGTLILEGMDGYTVKPDFASEGDAFTDTFIIEGITPGEGTVLNVTEGCLSYSGTASEASEVKVRAAVEYVIGDLNNDGKIDSSDATKILAAYSLLSTGGNSGLSPSEELAADVKKDGKINSSDASLILAYYSYRSTGGTKPLEDVIDAL